MVVAPGVVAGDVTGVATETVGTFKDELERRIEGRRRLGRDRGKDMVGVGDVEFEPCAFRSGEDDTGDLLSGRDGDGRLPGGPVARVDVRRIRRCGLGGGYLCTQLVCAGRQLEKLKLPFASVRARRGGAG
jgi:hypothetical protein